MPVAIHHPGYADYCFGEAHPFHPDRYAMTLDLCRELGLALDPVAPPPVPEELLLAVHDPAYVAAVAAACRDLAPRPEFGLGPPDNPLTPTLERGARLVAGGTVHAAELLLAGRARRVLQVGGGLHHARPARAAGFCLYNDLALAVTRLADAGWHVAYLDIDVHHGDGVQEIFIADDRVLTLSLHESGAYLYPGTGGVHELGRGMGRGLSLNVPLPPGAGDDAYLAAFDLAAPAALEWFRPDVLVLQAGADAHVLDPLADLALTTRGYRALFDRVTTLAEAHTGGRLLVTLGGGYDAGAAARVWALLALHLWEHPVVTGNEDVALPSAWRDRWRRRLGATPPLRLDDPPDLAPPPDPHRRREAEAVARRLLDAACRHWV